MFWIQPFNQDKPKPAQACVSEREAVERGCDLLHQGRADQVRILEGEILESAHLSSTLGPRITR